MNINVLIAIAITAAVVAPIAWFAGANNARRTIAFKNAVKATADTLRD